MSSRAETVATTSQELKPQHKAHTSLGDGIPAGVLTAAAGLLVLGLALWLGLGFSPNVPVGYAAVSYRVLAPAATLPFIGVLVGASAATLYFSVRATLRSLREAMGATRTPGAPHLLDRFAPLLGGAIIGAALLLIAAVEAEQIDAVRATLVLTLGVLTLLSAGYLLEDLARGNAIRIDSHWGGLGGSLGGWRVSQTLTLFLITLIFLGSMLAVASGGAEGESTSTTSARTPLHPTTTSTQTRPEPVTATDGTEAPTTGKEITDADLEKLGPGEGTGGATAATPATE